MIHSRLQSGQEEFLEARGGRYTGRLCLIQNRSLLAELYSSVELLEFCASVVMDEKHQPRALRGRVD